MMTIQHFLYLIRCASLSAVVFLGANLFSLRAGWFRQSAWSHRWKGNFPSRLAFNLLNACKFNGIPRTSRLRTAELLLMTKDGVGKIFKGWSKNLIANHVPVPAGPKSSNACKLKIILNLDTLAKRVLSSSALQISCGPHRRGGICRCHVD